MSHYQAIITTNKTNIVLTWTLHVLPLACGKKREVYKLIYVRVCDKTPMFPFFLCQMHLRSQCSQNHKALSWTVKGNKTR